MKMPENPSVAQESHRAALPHPAAIIVLWLFLAIALQSLHAPAMLGLGGLLIAAALRMSAMRFYALMRRTRWVMISLLVIYGYVTPGEAIWAPAGTLSPTMEGVMGGALQLCRLAFALAGLSIVLHLLDQRLLMGGIYVLAYPLQLLGLSRERVAVRLALTLNYAETAMLETATDWRASIERLLAPPDDGKHEVELQSIPFRPRDGVLLAAGGILLAVTVL